MTITEEAPVYTPYVAPAPTPDGVPDDAPRAGSDSDLWCEAGSHFFEHTGRGRKPKNCLEHRKVATPRATSQTKTIGALEDSLSANIVGMGVAVSMFDQYCGSAIVAGGPNLSHALCDVAKRDPKVRKALERAMGSMGWGQVITAAAMIAIPIAAHHRLMPTRLVENLFSAVNNNRGSVS